MSDVRPDRSGGIQYKGLAPFFLTACLSLFFLLPPNGSAQDEIIYEGGEIPAHIEAMYQRGLQFLLRSQNSDGSWPGRYGNYAGPVGLCVVAMLAHGEDPNHGPYSSAIKKGVNFILANVNPSNGYIGQSMYNHGFATLALAEAYGTVNNDKIGPALQKAIDMILTSQKGNSRGGWRYSPQGSDADTTVSGAQMVALLAARNAGLEIPDEAIKRGVEYLKSCQASDGGIGYTSASGGNAPRTAIAVTVLGIARYKEDEGFKKAFTFLKQLGYSPGSYSYYNLYYSAQAYFHADMKEFAAWNQQNAVYLAQQQTGQGSWTGSHGETFSTGAALLSLALNYRMLPIYER